jgi:TorA maturation chaperone TorD
MSAAVTPLKFEPPEVPEDYARAGYYALLARLFYSSPDAALLETIGGAEEIAGGAGQSPLADAWNRLGAAARATDAVAARLEYDEIFVGTGKAEVTPYATYYLAEAGREKILVRLRGELAELGLARSEAAREPEDHFAGLLDVMRHLILLGSDDAALQNQAAFFGRYLAPACPRFCSAISECAKADFYRHVAHFDSAFFIVETEAMKMF